MKTKVEKDNKVTEWNDKPREMWVWDNDSDDKIAKRKVVYICNYDNYDYPVVVATDNGEITSYRFCKEISTETKKRPYKDNYEFIADYLLRFGADSSDSIRPSCWRCEGRGLLRHNTTTPDGKYRLGFIPCFCAKGKRIAAERAKNTEQQVQADSAESHSLT